MPKDPQLNSSPTTYRASAFNKSYLQSRLGSDRLAQVPYDPAHFQKHFTCCWHKLNIKKDDTVLDLGCGTGYNSWWFAQMAERVVGVDISAEAMAFAQKHYQKANLRYLQGDILEWAPQGKFSLIIITEVFEHLPLDEGNLFLTRIKPWLRPHGRIGLQVPTGKSWTSQSRKKRRQLTTLDGSGDPTHLRLFSAHDLRDLVQAQGYRILREAPIYGRLILSRKWIRRLVKLLRPPLCLKDQLTMDLLLVLTPLET